LKILRCTEYSSQKLSQLSQWNNWLHDPASNTNCFLSRVTCVSPTHLNKTIWNKVILFQPSKTYIQGSILFKN
jgi:hypothetical protein